MFILSPVVWYHVMLQINSEQALSEPRRLMKGQKVVSQPWSLKVFFPLPSYRHSIQSCMGHFDEPEHEVRKSPHTQNVVINDSVGLRRSNFTVLPNQTVSNVG